MKTVAKAETTVWCLLLSLGLAAATASPAETGGADARVRKSLDSYLRTMAEPKPFTVRQGQEFKDRQTDLRARLLRCVNLSPLPERVPLDVRQTEPLDHPWCTVRRVYFQVLPGLYQNGLLYMPKALAEKPAPAMLCPHGHWPRGNAYPDEQKRCLIFAKMGYVTFSPTQQHYEALGIGVSHETSLIWNNMRSLDYLESLPEVDKSRIGCCGASGGGLQTQFLTALDDRVKAATIVGMTCDWKNEIGCYGTPHCGCNHFPQMMRHTDQPEISALACPVPVMYLTMDDWTRNFERDNFPTIRKLYEANSAGDRTACFYEKTGHEYGKTKRERTYRWMQKWIRGKETADGSEYEPKDVTVFPEDKLEALKLDIPADKGKGFNDGGDWKVGACFKEKQLFRAPAIPDKAAWLDYRKKMQAALSDILGEGAKLPRAAGSVTAVSSETRDGIVEERILYPSEGGLVLPATVLRPEKSGQKLPVVIFCDGKGAGARLVEKGADSPAECARKGALAVVADTRLSGPCAVKLSRALILWGRPVVGMACTDIRAILDALAARPDADTAKVRIVSRNSGPLGLAALFAAALDDRIAAADLDLGGYKLGIQGDDHVVPFVLQHGDIPQWASLLADRSLTLQGLSVDPKAPDRAWLAGVFLTAGNAPGLTMRP